MFPPCCHGWLRTACSPSVVAFVPPAPLHAQDDSSSQKYTSPRSSVYAALNSCDVPVDTCSPLRSTSPPLRKKRPRSSNGGYGYGEMTSSLRGGSGSGDDGVALEQSANNDTTAIYVQSSSKVS